MSTSIWLINVATVDGIDLQLELDRFVCAFQSNANSSPITATAALILETVNCSKSDSDETEKIILPAECAGR